jgi:peptidoglycan/LPS O-acetylase OafA/YrhL
MSATSEAFISSRRFALRPALRGLLWSKPTADPYWRPHIDGLRAIAVLTVLFYHAGFTHVMGGFVGVDVFFVISGFLISQIIYRDVITRQKFDIANFYERRARRILPVFFIVTAATLLSGYFLLLPQAFATLGQSAAYASGFASNIFFFWHIGYFAAGLTSFPLLHYWSLGVEEQFYIFFPLVVYLLAKISKNVVIYGVLVAGILSFGLSQYYVSALPTAGFYLAPPRAWELMVGCVLAWPTFQYARRRLQREIVAAAGLALILYAVWTFNALTPFPGSSALLPVMGSACILWGCEGSPTLVGALLSVRPLRYVGLWSYSIYMVHWPIIAFSHVIWPLGLPWFSTGIVVVSVGLGGLSYFIVELPFRRPRRPASRPRVFQMSFAALGITAALGFLVVSMNGFPDRLPPTVQRILAYNNYNYFQLYRQSTCFLGQGQGWENLAPSCLARDDRPAVLLWGDSLAAHLFEALKDRSPAVDLLQANMASCLPIAGFVFSGVPDCRNFNQAALKWSLANKPDLIVLSAAWYGAKDWLSDLDVMLGELQTAGIPVIIIGGTPVLNETGPNILARRMLRGDQNILAGAWDIGAQFWSDYYLKGRYSSWERIHYISSQDTVCKQGTCPLLTPSGVPMFWDPAHLTREGAEFFVDRMLPGGLLPNVR